MVSSRKAVSVSEAIASILAHCRPGEREWIDLSEACGRTLAQDIYSDGPIPPFDRSPYDGYAIRAEDTRQASPQTPALLREVGSVRAGRPTAQAVRSGEAIRIMTGAPIPPGADAVIPFERIREHTSAGIRMISVLRPLRSGDNISQAGEDIRAGALVVPRAAAIEAGEAAVLATFGHRSVPVYRKPVVGILVTGSELVDIGAPLAHGKIRNSNTAMLTAQIVRSGGTPKPFPIVPDREEALHAAATDALRQTDVLLTTGGASVGDYDFVPDLLARMNASILFNKVAMRPGSVTTAAMLQHRWIFGLSGNPSACFVGFELFVRPVIRAFNGLERPEAATIRAVLLHDLDNKGQVERFIRAGIRIRGSQIVAGTAGLDKSGAISSLLNANALIRLPARRQTLRQGEEVEVLYFGPDSGLPLPPQSP